MLLSRAVIDRYTQGVNGISRSAQEALQRRLNAIDWGDKTQAINEAVEAVEAVTGASAAVSAQLAAAFYSEVRMSETGEDTDAGFDDGHSAEGTERAVRSLAQKAVEGDVQGFTDALLARADYEVKRAAGEAVMSRGRRDRRRVRFARVPSGGETCKFCLMLASRGFVYLTAESAGENGHYHSGCDCRIVPSFGKTEVQGYDPEAIYERWVESQRKDVE